MLAQAGDIVRYLASGKYDPGAHGDCLSRSEYCSILREALIEEVCRLEQLHTAPPITEELNPEAFIRNKLYSLVKGLFPTTERERVLGMLVETVLLMTPQNANRLIEEADLETAWKAADFYLASLGSTGLSGNAEYPVVLDAGELRLVSLEYFRENEPFVDHLVHEAARMVCSARRGNMGLRQTKSRIWLVVMAPARHGMFAHACEVYSRIRERSRGPVQRRKILREYAGSPAPAGRQVQRTELLRILKSAVDVRDGWKRILLECSEYRQGNRGGQRRPRGRSGRTEPGLGPERDPGPRFPQVEHKVHRGRPPHLTTTRNPPGRGGTLPYNKTPLQLSWKPSMQGRLPPDAAADAPTAEVPRVDDTPCPLPGAVPLGQVVQLTVDQRRRLWGTVTMISEDGLCIDCSEVVTERTYLRIFLPLTAEDHSQKLQLVQGRVVWRRDKQVMMLFADLEQEVARQIKRLVGSAL